MLKLYDQKSDIRFPLATRTAREMRAAMGLGDTFGPLEEEYGGTGMALSTMP